MKDLEKKGNFKRWVRPTKFAKDNFGDKGFNMEARILFGNANVPFGYKPGTSNLAFNVPCKDEAQGKKQLVEFIEGLEKDNDTQKVVAEWFQSKPNLKFDNSSIPDEFKTTS